VGAATGVACGAWSGMAACRVTGWLARRPVSKSRPPMALATASTRRTSPEKMASSSATSKKQMVPSFQPPVER
jgi:hypothetical protein